MSRLKINFEKSEILLVTEDSEKPNMLVEMFNCQCGKWPIKYLGTHVCARRTTMAEMEFVSEKIKKNMGGWLGGTMSIGGRVIKIDACL
jgi:hypothetical protein